MHTAPCVLVKATARIDLPFLSLEVIMPYSVLEDGSGRGKDQQRRTDWAV